MHQNYNASVRLAETLANHEKLGYMVVDSQLKVISTNAEAQNIFNLDRGGFEGLLITDIFPGISQTEYIISICNALNGETSSSQSNDLASFGIHTKKKYRFSFLPFSENEDSRYALLLIKYLPEPVWENNAQEGKFDFMADRMDVGIWEINLEGNTIYLNKGMCSILNIDDAKDMVGKTFHCFFTPKSLEAIKAEHTKRLSHHTSVYEVELIDAKGVIKNVIVNGAPAFDKEGNIKGQIATFTDITEKINYQKELKKSEERFRMLFEKSFRANLVLNKKIITLANEALIKLFGYNSSSELVGQSALILLSPQSVGYINERIARVERNEVVERSFELIFLRKDGTEFPGEVEVTYLESSEGKSTHISIKDITDQKAAEEALKNSEAKFRSLFNTQMLGITFADKDQKVVEANDKFLEIINYTREEFKERVLHWQDLTPEEYLRRDEIAVQEFMKNGFITPYEKEYVRRDGKRVPVLVASAILGGFRNLGVGFIVDISELKRSKEETHKIAEELSKFLYMASHDLKGPLASVIGLTMVAKNEVEDEKAIEYFSLIEKCTKKLDSSLMNLMKIIRIKSNVFEFVEINFNRLIQEVMDTLIYHPGNDLPSLELLVDLKAPFYSDKELLASIFQNLIENSIKYQSMYRKLLLKVEVNDLDNAVEIKVSDNGRGISEKVINKIFDMFYRGDSSSKGSGLGLYIVKNGVEKFNGTISVRNIVTGGAEFRIVLPRENSKLS